MHSAFDVRQVSDYEDYATPTAEQATQQAEDAVIAFYEANKTTMKKIFTIYREYATVTHEEYREQQQREHGETNVIIEKGSEK